MENGAAVERLRKAGQGWTDAEALLAAAARVAEVRPSEGLRIACSRLSARRPGTAQGAKPLAIAVAAGYAVGRAELGDPPPPTAGSPTEQAVALLRACRSYDLRAVGTAAGAAAASVRETVVAASPRPSRRRGRGAFALGPRPRRDRARRGGAAP